MATSNFKLKVNDTNSMDLTLYSPDDRNMNNGRLVLIAPGMGIQKSFYKELAGFLALQGFDVLTWDWLGIGESCSHKIKSIDVSAHDWATIHFSKVIDWSKSKNYQRVIGIGHSFGGQCFMLNEKARQLDKLVFVASQIGAIKLWKGKTKLFFQLVMFLMPILSKLFGYFPSKLFGMGHDLPKNVAIQWAQWCRNDDYNTKLMYFKNWYAPVLFIRIANDPYAPKLPADLLFKLIPTTKKKMTIVGDETGLSREIGHFGYFKKKLCELYWKDLVEFVNR